MTEHGAYRMQGERLPAKLEALEAVRTRFRSYLSELKTPTEDLEAWELIISEAWNNAVFHGSPADDCVIEVHWWCESNMLYLALTDSGCGPAEQFRKTMSTPTGLSEKTPRGLFLIDQLCVRREHWISESGHRLVICREHRGDSMPTEDEGMVERLLEELSSCYESLAAFYRMSRYLVEPLSLRDFVNQLLQTLRNGQDFDSIRIMLASNAPWFIKRQLSSLRGVEMDSFSSNVLRRSLGKHEEVVWNHVEELTREESEFLNARGCSMPVLINGETAACLLVGRRASAAPFISADLSKLRTFSELLGMVLTEACLRRVRDRDQKALREFEIATDIQRNLLPIRTPVNIPAYDLCIRHNSAEQISGDYVELLKIDKTCWCGAIIDVMGKGVSAALLATMFRTAFITLAGRQEPLEAIMSTLNTILHKQIGGLSLFITCTLIRLNVKTHRIELVNAGHCPSLFLKKNQDMESLDASGPPLGLFASQDYTCDERSMEVGDTLMLVTDGCYEWTEMGEPYGWERFRNLAFASLPGNPAHFWDYLQRMISANVQREQRCDDETFLSIRRTLP